MTTRGAAIFLAAAVVGGLAGLGVVRAVEGSVRPLDAAAGWLVACASAGLARWINSRSLRRAAAGGTVRGPRGNPLAPLAANGLRWLGLVAILAGYAFVFPAGFAAFGLMAAVTSLAFVGAEVTHLYLTDRRRE